MFKNVAGQKLTVFAFDATTSLPKPGDAANISAYVNKDGAGVNQLADTSATEIDATNSKGFYEFDLAQAESNGDKLHFTGKSTTANIVVIAIPAVCYTLPSYLGIAVGSSGALITLGVGAGQFSVDGSGNADVNIVNWKGATAPAMTGDAYARIGANGAGLTGVGLAAGAIDIPQFTASLMQLLTRRLDLAGVTSPVTADTYQVYGFYNGTVYYKSTTLGTPIFVWYDGSAHWIASTVLGTAGASYFQTGTSVNGTWTHQGAATGTPAATAHGNSVLSAFQPDASSAFAVILSAITALQGVTPDDFLDALLGGRATGSVGGALQNLGRALITVVTPVTGGGTIDIVQGDDYKSDNNRAIPFSLPVADFGDLSDATVRFVAKRSGSTIGPITGAIVSPNADGQGAEVELAAADTASARASDNDNDTYDYACRVTKDDELITTFRGRLILRADLFAG